MNELAILQQAELEQRRPLSAIEIRAQVNLIQEVMKGVMRRDVHYGQIPGTPKPTLYKAGAEKILATFRLAVDYRTEDLSTLDGIRYRVTAVATSNSGTPLGSAIGEASSDEEKYRWRSIVHIKEWDATPEDRRRLKFYKNGGETKQVRTNPSDVANTILKMACKRALVAVTLQVTAASDIFGQDIEDLPEEVRESIASDGPPVAPDTFREAPKASADTDEKIETGLAMLGYVGPEREELLATFASNKEGLLNHLRAEVRARKAKKDEDKEAGK